MKERRGEREKGRKKQRWLGGDARGGRGYKGELFCGHVTGKGLLQHNRDQNAGL